MDTDTPDTRLQGLALAWLSTRSEKKAGTRSELAKTLHAFVEHRWSRGEWSGRFDTLLTGLMDGKLVEARGRSGLALTGAGRQQALKFLRVDSPKGLTWKRVKQQHLLAKGLGLPASKPALTRVSDADGVRAMVLKRAHRVEGPETPTLAQVRDRLLWRQLGVETEEAFSLRAVQAHLLGKLLEQEVSDPKRGVEQLAARAVGASRVDAEVVRMAALREWVLAESPVKTLPTDTVSFARRVMDAAQAVPPSGRFGNNKVFISHVWKALEPVCGDRPSFNEALLKANRARELTLGRADLLAAMDTRDITESEIRTIGATFHFVVL